MVASEAVSYQSGVRKANLITVRFRIGLIHVVVKQMMINIMYA